MYKVSVGVTTSIRISSKCASDLVCIFVYVPCVILVASTLQELLSSNILLVNMNMYHTLKALSLLFHWVNILHFSVCLSRHRLCVSHRVLLSFVLKKF